jgi:site-specific DNA-methyltransferase (adenine-specific)
MEQAGFVLEPEGSLSAWAYGSGFPKSHNTAVYMDRMLTEGRSRQVKRRGVGNLNGRFADAAVGFESQSKAHKIKTPQAKGWDGWQTALKPAWESVVVGRKPVE